MKYVHAPGSHAPLAVWVRALGVVEVSDVRKVRDYNKYRIEKVSATPLPSCSRSGMVVANRAAVVSPPGAAYKFVFPELSFANGCMRKK
jgi:hypothetical protein